jgi:FkbM family methyltransferase
MMSRNLALRLARRLAAVRSRRAPASPYEVERAEWAFYIRYLREGMVVFDAGANVGELTLLFSHFIGLRGQVHAFEASGATFQRLTTICELAGCKNVALNHLALADSEGLVHLHVYDDDHAGWNTLAERPLYKWGIDAQPIRTDEVPATTVDIYCEKNGIAQLDLLKIDVEGAEYQVLLGARWMLSENKIRCCIFEFGQATLDMGNTPGQIEAYLGQSGYRIRNVVRRDPLFPGGRDAPCFSMLLAVPE